MCYPQLFLQSPLAAPYGYFYARLINEMMRGFCCAKQCLPLKRISKFPDVHTHNPCQSYVVLVNSHWEWNTRVKNFRLLQRTWATGPPTILFIELNVRACKYCGPHSSSTLGKMTEAIVISSLSAPEYSRMSKTLLHPKVLYFIVSLLSKSVWMCNQKLKSTPSHWNFLIFLLQSYIGAYAFSKLFRYTRDDLYSLCLQKIFIVIFILSYLQNAVSVSENERQEKLTLKAEFAKYAVELPSLVFDQCWRRLSKLNFGIMSNALLVMLALGQALDIEYHNIRKNEQVGSAN